MTASRFTVLPVSANLTCTAGPLRGRLHRPPSTACALWASSGTVMGSTSPTRPQPSANTSQSRIPKMPASTSFTPPSAASDWCAYRWQRCPFAPAGRVRPGGQLFSGLKMTGWWDTMSSQPRPQLPPPPRGDVQRHQHPGHPAAAVHQQAGVIQLSASSSGA